MKKMELQVQRLLSYRVVFPERHDKIEDLISTVPSNSAIEFLSFVLAQRVNQLIGDHDTKIWCPWVMNTRSDVKNAIGQYAQQYNLAQFSLLDKYALLVLISKVLSNYNGGNDDLTQEDFSNLLLAYLICCDERLLLNKNRPNNSMTADCFVENYLPDCLITNDIESPRDYRLLLIKCYMLMVEFPKENTTFAGYVDEFCKEKVLPNAKKYLDEIFLSFLGMTSTNLSNCRLEVDEKDETAIRFFDSLSIDPSRYKHDKDFLMMRERPILKIGPRKYNIMFMKMFLDKAYSGLLFDMKDALVRRGVLDDNMGYSNLKSFLGEEFSEKYFFYTLMRRCFGQRYVAFCGEELEKKLGGGMPDYYLRRGNRVFLFECKDAQLATSRKLSGEYETIKESIFEKYVVNSKGHPKGIRQLEKVIIRKLPYILREMDYSAPKGVIFVFPIIVYFDDCFDAEGPSYLLNKEFRNLIGDSEENGYVVKDVVMVNIEQLMRLENFFVNDKLKLTTVINAYIEYKNQAELNQVFPFNKFIFQEAKKKGYEMKKTRWFDEVYHNLVDLDKSPTR